MMDYETDRKNIWRYWVAPKHVHDQFEGFIEQYSPDVLRGDFGPRRRDWRTGPKFWRKLGY